jgi:hypothetical protein
VVFVCMHHSSGFAPSQHGQMGKPLETTIAISWASCRAAITMQLVMKLWCILSSKLAAAAATAAAAACWQDHYALRCCSHRAVFQQRL